MRTTLTDNFIEVDKDDLIDSAAAGIKPSPLIDLLTDEEKHLKLLNYLTARLQSDADNRLRRVRRYALIDQTISTWQKLSPEDSKRAATEASDGKSQAIPLNVPMIKASLEDTTAFYSEIFAPIGGNYYADPGKRAKSAKLQLLTKKMNQDSKHNDYYAEVTATLSSMFKYNCAGFHIEWNPGRDADRSPGNNVTSLDMYNFFYDGAITDVHKLSKEGEWSAMAEVKPRIWFLRQRKRQSLLNLDKILLDDDGGSNQSAYGKADYYRYPPAETKINDDGGDTIAGFGESTAEPNWKELGLDSSTGTIDIAGYEVVKMYCWLNRRQFNLMPAEEIADGKDELALFKFQIACGRWIISAEDITESTEELPTYLSRMSRDELREADRSAAEHLRPFQRFVSFLMNTHIAGTRSNIWGFTIYDPSMIDSSKIRAGDVAGMIPTKLPLRDVRTAMHKLSMTVDTSRTMGDAASVIDLSKMLSPNQAMPAQIASIDRAVTNQVSTILQGSHRKLHMICRIMDSSLFRPLRLAQYRNIAQFDPDKNLFSGITPEEISELLNSGLGQMTREAAAEQIRTLIFALLQNPNAAQGIDMQGLWTLYSGLLNIGTDLGEFLLQPTVTNQAPTDGSAAPGAEGGPPAAPV